MTDDEFASGPLPVLSAAKCVGCARCWEVCPARCLAPSHLGIGLAPYLARPLDCIHCAACALVCPTDAIQLVEPERTP